MTKGGMALQLLGLRPLVKGVVNLAQTGHKDLGYGQHAIAFASSSSMGYVGQEDDCHY